MYKVFFHVRCSRYVANRSIPDQDQN